MTLDDQAAYWNEWALSLERAGFTREEAVQMTTTAMCTNMWIVAFKQSNA
jgi:hypothetical protein